MSALTQSSSGNALAKIENAYDRFSRTVSRSDARMFQDSALEDVWEAAKDIEGRLGRKGEYRNMRRIEPFLKGLGQYSAAVEVLCNGTPYLPWIWGPVKLFLQIASDYQSAFEKLIKAYAEIAAALPRFDRLSKALKDDHNFQCVLAVFYCDIIEFHRRAYKFFRSSGWKRFFDSSWGRFDIRFKGVMGDIRYHADLVDKEAGAASIATAEEWRMAYFENIQKEEQMQAEQQLQAVLTWLDTKDYLQDDYFNDLCDRCCPGTNLWFLEHSKVQSWIGSTSQSTGLWLNGIPGSGKSILAAQLVKHLEGKKDAIVCYYFCNFRSNDLNTCSFILRSLACQILKQHKPGVALTYDEYIVQGKSASKTHLKQLIPVLLDGLPVFRAVIDGLDECPIEDQKEILPFLRQITTTTKSTNDLKVAFSSRDVPVIYQALKRQSAISLKDETGPVEEAIKLFVNQEVKILRQGMEEHYVDNDVFSRLESRILDKAGGMFLWVRLVLESLKDLNSAYDLEMAVENLPNGLQEAYDRVLQHISQDNPRGSLQRAAAVLSLVSAARRPLTKYEVLDGVAFCIPPNRLDGRTRLAEPELDRCKPLIEIDRSGFVSFVHFTVKEYISDHSSGPFLSLERAAKNMTMACFGYMRSSLELVDPRVTEQQRVVNTVKGFHGLQRYAMCYWLPHFQQLMDIYQSQSKEADEDLIIHMSGFCKRHEELLQEIRPESASQPSELHEQNEQPIFGRIPELRAFILNSQDQQGSSEQVRGATPSGRSTVTISDPTLLTQITLVYNAIIQQLIQADSSRSFPYLSDFEILLFKEKYANTLFACNVLSCPRRSQGFATKGELDIHERVHQPRIYCPVIACPFATTGFRTPAQLKTHRQKYHPIQSSEIPQFRAGISGTDSTSLPPIRRLVPFEEDSTPSEVPRTSEQLLFEDFDIDEDFRTYEDLLDPRNLRNYERPPDFEDFVIPRPMYFSTKVSQN